MHQITKGYAAHTLLLRDPGSTMRDMTSDPDYCILARLQYLLFSVFLVPPMFVRNAVVLFFELLVIHEVGCFRVRNSTVTSTV